MRTILIAFFLLFIADAFGQIDIMETKEKEYSKPPAYDSTYNFGSFKDIMRFSGQIIYLIPISKKYKGSESKYEVILTKKKTVVKNPDPYPQIGEDSLALNIFKPIYVKSNSYGGSFFTPIDSIIGKYYKIRSIVENPDLKDKFRHSGTYLDIVSKDNNRDSILFQLSPFDRKVLDNILFGKNDSYIIQGYYEKLQKKFLNKKFYLSTNISNIWDTKTGKIINIDTTNKEWICNSLSFIETESNRYLQLCLIFKNGEKTIAIGGVGNNEKMAERLSESEAWQTISLLNFKTEEDILLEKMQAVEIEKGRKEALLREEEERKRILLEKAQFESEMIKKYGIKIAKLILGNKVIIGMNKEICKLSWGEPYDINRTITKSRIFEQWVYSMGTYLYFENDILVAIQD